MARRSDFSPKLAVFVFLIVMGYMVWGWLSKASIVVKVWLLTNKSLAIFICATFIVMLVLIIVLIKMIRANKLKKRIAFLQQKYNDESVVRGIISKSFWVGATESMLIDSIGDPEDKDREVMKRKTKETWKYHKKQANQYYLKIYIENGHVVGWDKKS